MKELLSSVPPKPRTESLGSSLSIIVVNWNTADYLLRCLESTENQDYRGLVDVIVIDNGSSDGSSEVVTRNFPAVRLIQNNENHGFARANNRGILESNGDFILLLNPDTELGRDSLQILVEFLEKNPEVGAAGPMLFDPNGTLQISCYPRPTLFREFWRLFHFDQLWPIASYPMTDWSSQDPREVDSIQGACLMVRRLALQEVGLLDEEYFMYSEEVDLCRRIQARGWKLFWVPRAEVTHYGGRSSRQAQETMFLQLYRSKIVYFRKHRGEAAACLYKLILFLTALSRQVLSVVAPVRPVSHRRQDRLVAGYYRKLIGVLPGL